MKIRVVLTVQVDPDAWNLIYDTAIDELRTDVRDYAAEQLRHSAAAYESAITSVKVN